MNTKERLIIYLTEKGIAKTAFEGISGLSKGQMAKNQGFSADSLEKIANSLPELSMDWLITGKGEMLKSEAPITGGIIYESENARLHREVERLHRENESLSKKVITLLEEARELERKPTAGGAQVAPAGRVI